MDNVAYIPIGRNGHQAIVDAEDVSRLLNFGWYLEKGKAGRLAARTYVRWPDGSDTWISMPHIIMPTVQGYIFDHINGDGLDNRKKNLRRATVAQNNCNKVRGGKGYHWDKRCQKWRVQISIGNRNIHIGMFEDETAAVVAYNMAAVEYYGEFARVRPVQEPKVGEP